MNRLGEEGWFWVQKKRGDQTDTREGAKEHTRESGIKRYEWRGATRASRRKEGRKKARKKGRKGGGREGGKAVRAQAVDVTARGCVMKMMKRHDGKVWVHAITQAS